METQTLDKSAPKTFDKMVTHVKNNNAHREICTFTHQTCLLYVCAEVNETFSVRHSFYLTVATRNDDYKTIFARAQRTHTTKNKIY